MEPLFARYTEQMISRLPYWFKMKKKAKESLGAHFLNITGLEFDNMKHILEYAYEQTKIETIDDDFVDITYKAILPMNQRVKDIKSVYSSTDALIKAENLAHFFGIGLDGIEYPEVYGNNIYFADEKKNILYVRNPYDSTDKAPYGSIDFVIEGQRLKSPLALHHVWNFFDEFGLLLDCPRLNEETNKDYKKRILDVFKNPAGAHTMGLVNGIARELDLRTIAIWEDGGRDYIIEDPMVVLNTIAVDGILIGEEDIFLTSEGAVLLKGDQMYEDITRELSYVSGLEMHELHDKEDHKLYNELFNVDKSATSLLKYYTERIHAAAPIMWGHFKWDESYWDISDKDLGGVAFIPNLYDSQIEGFRKFNKK